MSAEYYDPEQGTLCGPCISNVYLNIGYEIVSGVATVLFFTLGFIIYHTRTLRLSRRAMVSILLASEKVLFSSLLFGVFITDALSMHLWRIGPIGVFCPPSVVNIATQIMIDLLCCFIFLVAFSLQNRFLVRYYMWMPCVLQLAKYISYFSDIVARGDICWIAWASLVVVVLAVLNVITVPYVSMGKIRTVVADQGMEFFRPISPMSTDDFRDKNCDSIAGMTETAISKAELFHGDTQEDVEQTIELEEFKRTKEFPKESCDDLHLPYDEDKGMEVIGIKKGDNQTSYFTKPSTRNGDEILEVYKYSPKLKRYVKDKSETT